MIYIVDDDAAVRESLQVILEISGHDVRSFPSGEAFFDALPELPKGCLLLDLQMPGMHGLELLAHLRSIGHDLKVFIMTGAAEDSDRRRAARLGAAQIFDKPFDPMNLCGIVTEAVSGPAPSPARY